MMKPRQDPVYKSRPETHKDMPSFSSILLDEIYRSIDGNPEEEEQHFQQTRQGGGFRAKCSTGDRKDIADYFRRACLVESWMTKEEDDRKVASSKTLFPDLEPKHDNDLLFFSSTSSSSDSSGTLSSSSDTEFFGPTTKTKVSCFTTRPRPKPVRTATARKPVQDDCSFFDDYKTHQKDDSVEDGLIKSKSRALKIYANLKKMKQPISPGGRLTTFINSLFSSNANGNKSKAKHGESDKSFHNSKSSNPRPPSSSTCSSASSFSRSCLSKYSPKSREKMREGVQRTVRFHPVSVIVDEDSRPCGHKCIYDEEDDCGDDDDDKYGNGRPPLPPNEPTSKRGKSRKLEEASIDALRSYYRKRGSDDSKKIILDEDDDEDDDDDDYDIDEDGGSDSSSDLFELDHLSLFGEGRFCEELPVYETTRFDKNRGLIC
ncbi:protein BIG GRAIN 1-like A [Andrographis paniculata]|uniref:protein BIG GRAIN 1-like A n=1 Tax=Andrographis paniculata TaxID=175694 RepID=UPI0021E74FD8|nr:protein BIG GRAIN 1-like A [Andrographis paniculata]